MVELSERMFYKVKFNIELIDKQDDLLWKIVLHIKKRYTKKWNSAEFQQLPTDNRKWTKFKNGCRIWSLDGQNTVYLESNYYNDGEKLCWACIIVERNPVRPGYAAQTWTTQIGLEQDKGCPAQFTCVLTYNNSVDFIGPCLPQPDWSVPKIVKNILLDSTLRCTSGNEQINMHPEKIAVGGWYDFWNRIINPSRQLPIIYLSPYEKIDNNGNVTITTSIDPNALAETLCGNVFVMYSDDTQFELEMRECCRYGYMCINGQVRIYFPNVDILNDDDQYRHKYLSRARIEEIGEADFISIFRRVFAQDLHYYEDKSFISIKYCEKLHREYLRQEKIDKLKAEHASEYAKLETGIWDEMEKLEQQLSESETLCDTLDRENDSLKQRNYALSSQIEGFRSMAEKASLMEAAVKARTTIPELPNSVNSVVEYFCSVFGDRIAISADGYKTLKDCTLLPAELWKVFFHLSTTMYDLLNSECATPYDEFRLITGIDCARSEGAMTRKDSSLMRQFQTEINGEIIDIEPHITYPKERQSIHFGKALDGRIIIGSCGPHKEIYSSRKVK